MPKPATATAAANADKPRPLPKGPDSIKRVEELTRRTLGDGTLEQHMALLELLTYIYLDSFWAIYARNAVITNSDELRDHAADLLIVEAQEGGGNG